MKNAGRRDDGIIAAAAILVAVVLLGCLATFVHCARVPTDDVTGERAAEATTSPDHPLPFCYKACGNGRCDFCCASDYTPTFCWDSEAMCKHECHPPMRP